MSKFRIVMDMDFAELAPEDLDGTSADIAVVKDVVSKSLIEGARAQAKRDLHTVRRDRELDQDVKAIRMAEQLRKIMMTMMAEANLSVEELPASTPISTKLPFEDRYEDAVIHRVAA